MPKPPTQYDDGGFSGGNLDRPALKRLLADIAAGKVDTVVVYKIDRLTRSLGDFAKIVDQFDAAKASFVSITQAFNTTTSMGRLTLNILLSFAQFEREVTGERIRDKIAQSKAKGMWMGGRVPLGYGRKGRLYRYYIAMALQKGRKAPEGALRRIGADALETVVLDQLRRLADRMNLERADLEHCVKRVELGQERTELVLSANHIFDGRHTKLALQDLQARLQDGERAVWDGPGRSALRLVLPIRMQLRGGRTFFDGGAERVITARPNLGLVQGLKAAHSELLGLHASPLSPPAELAEAAAPVGPHRRQMSRLAFLAPDLQRKILEGRQPAKLKLRTVLKSELPLLWEDQRRWFSRLAA